MTSVLVVAMCIVAVSAHSSFRMKIPNGLNVPNPCGGGIWAPVGHYSPEHHTQEKNPFGQAFRAANFMWTVDLCNADSDGDGRSNGVELGDPTCVWVEGATPTGSATGQPGICEPIGSSQCSKQVFTCGCTGQACIGR